MTYSIQATFPTDLPKEKYIELMEGAMAIRAANEQGHACKMKYLKKHKGEYLFEITTDDPRGFYYIGMVAYSILKSLEKMKRKVIIVGDPKPPTENKTIYFKDN